MDTTETPKQKAGITQFNLLHNILTEAHIQKIQSGECTASDLKAAGEWLKANNITGVAFEGSPLDKLRLVVPQIDPEEVNRRVNSGAA